MSGATGRAVASGERMERELVQQAIAGDHDAFVSLAAATYDRLHRLARLILRDENGPRRRRIPSTQLITSQP
jgi:hypothetical protein